MRLTKEDIDLIDINTAGIYYITNNINGKGYIGQSLMLHKRLMDHLYCSTRKSHKNRYPLYLALNKYGIENFELTIIESFEKDNNTIQEQKNKLNDLEVLYIKKYNTFGEGYNQTIGGSSTSGYVFNDAVRKKLSTILTQYYREAEATYLVYDISTSEKYTFKNVFEFYDKFNIDNKNSPHRLKYKRNKSGYSIFMSKFIVSDNETNLDDQINRYLNSTSTRNYYSRVSCSDNHFGFQQTIDQVYLYNFILKEYYTFSSCAYASIALNRGLSSIYGIMARKARSVDGWVLAKSKEELEENKLLNVPSKKVLKKYNSMQVAITKYPTINIKISINNK